MSAEQIGKSSSKKVEAKTNQRSGVVDFVSRDRFRKETMAKEREVFENWKEKYDSGLIDEYRRLYEILGRKGPKVEEKLEIPLKRNEWQQEREQLPIIMKRTSGQRRRRILGTFPQTENDRIGWRLLPHQAIDIYGSRATKIAPLPPKYRFSSYPLESFQ